jgi:hypothetical protein
VDDRRDRDDHETDEEWRAERKDEQARRESATR